MLRRKSSQIRTRNFHPTTLTNFSTTDALEVHNGLLLQSSGVGRERMTEEVLGFAITMSFGESLRTKNVSGNVLPTLSESQANLSKLGSATGRGRLRNKKLLGNSGNFRSSQTGFLLKAVAQTTR